jgi:hypothetical protein
LYANILTKTQGAWRSYQQVAFSASSGGATFTYPLAGQTNVPASTTFTWRTVPEAQGYILAVGRAPYGADLANSGILPSAASSFPVNQLPSGITAHAVILTQVNGAWVNYQTITFTVAAT